MGATAGVGGARGGGPWGGAAASRARQRALCVWLAELSSRRAGVVARLVKRFGPLEEVLQRPWQELADVLGEGRRPCRETSRTKPVEAGSRSPSADGGSEERDAQLWSATLEQGPRAIAAPECKYAGHVSCVTWVDDLYPVALRDAFDPPAALFMAGRAARERCEALSTCVTVAIVGSRAPSPYGLELAASLASDLTAAGVTIVSGCAAGLDAAAQWSALEVAERLGVPATIGVLGCGVDVVYPQANSALFRAVVEKGLLLSEFMPGVRARAWRFPARNRVIAGLSRGVVIVEGSERSGSLITADFALDMGRDVFAVPGEAGRRLSAGPHRLLRQGAHLCESARDVLDVLSLADAGARSTLERPTLDSSPEPGSRERVLSALDDGERTLDDLAAVAGSPIAETAALVSALEVDGLIAPVAGGRYRHRRGRSP